MSAIYLVDVLSQQGPPLSLHHLPPLASLIQNMLIDLKHPPLSVLLVVILTFLPEVLVVQDDHLILVIMSELNLSDMKER